MRRHWHFHLFVGKEIDPWLVSVVIPRPGAGIFALLNVFDEFEILVRHADILTYKWWELQRIIKTT